MTTKPYTCTLLPEVTRDDPPRLGAWSNEAGVIAAFWREDDRRLFLAAPDLLEALQAIAEACEANADSAMGEGWVKAHEKLGAFARAAIAKATGRSV